ncbi:MAG: cupin domain-containing protein [Rhodobacterales bacterium]|jgi:gentisate 1,2-dioxygenase|nr:cupin domain-containing protein [Pseudomonadota bacterium]MDA1285069.1 cupin domain-containing protein [Pseudomonadota bacterium]NQW15303.1 cupin domain-containing protein [Rhodobacter sp.]
MAADNFSDDQLGRARVRDSDELEAYYEDLAKFETAALWTVANDIEPWQPTPASDAVIWRHADLRPHILRSLDLVTPEMAGRRVVYLRNPRRKEVSAACGWLFSGIQVMRPGESAPAHNHAASALRFIMEGKGAYTVVDGHRMTLGARDFVITPNGSWHEHGIEDDGEISMWQDGLDIPLTNALEANFYAVHPDDYQKSNLPTDASPATWGNPGMLPVKEKWDAFYSPLMKYSWDKTYEGLNNYAKFTDGDPFDGVILKYVNPQTGGHPMATMGTMMQMLRPSEHTKAHRHTGNVIYHVAKGEGYSVIGGTRFDWKEKDIFCVPPWVWHEHCNKAGNDDACLFQFNDFPVMEKLHFYKEQAYPENGGYQQVEKTA